MKMQNLSAKLGARLQKRQQRGFTLVEIAIVLLIVGLLIGGVLRGEELINSARVRNLVDQKSAVQTAYTRFKDRFARLPGDLTQNEATNLIAAAAQGSSTGNNGIIDTGEIFLSIQNLAASGMLTCTQCVAAQGSSLTKANTLTNYQEGFVGLGEFVFTTATGSGNAQFLGVAGGTAEAAAQRLAIYTGGNLPSSILFEFDRKLDDTSPATGVVRQTAWTGGSTDVSGGSTTCTQVVTGTNGATFWRTRDAGIAQCAAVIFMDK